MKRIAFLIVFLPFFVSGQTNQKVNTTGAQFAPAKMVNERILDDRNYLPASDVKPNYVPDYKKSNNRSSKYSITKIGSSNYGLQTNASIGRRIVVYPDGKMSSVWTTCNELAPYVGRGTGYNHFNGTTWFTPPVEIRIERDRAGWPNIGTLKVAGKDVEYVISHYASSTSTDPSGGIVLNINGGIGQSDWTQTFLDKASGPIWHRSAEGGDYIHLISNYSDTNKYVNNVRTPTVYSRYKISTGTFINKYIMLPGYDTSITKLGSGDDYAIDAKDSIVSIVIAGPRNYAYVNGKRELVRPGHVMLWKSTDYGTTFKRIMIDSIVAKMPTSIYDTFSFYYPDGAVSVIIDSQGYSKVVWSYNEGFMNIDKLFMTYTFRYGLLFWDEKTDTIRRIPSAQVWDRNGNGLLDLETAIRYQLTRTISNGKYSINSYGSTNDILTFPQITIDKSGNLFIIYSAIVEKAFYYSGQNDDDTAQNENLRDVYVIYSKDKGVTWGPAQNISNNPFMEDVFASVSKNCYGDKLHIIFQEDEDPGTDVQNYDPATVNSEYYVQVPISDILNNLIGPGDSIAPPNSVNNQERTFEIGNNYPNPFSDETYIDLKLNNRSTVVVTMNNVLGQQVLESTYSNLPAGKSTLSIDGSDLTPGIYFLNVKVGNEVKTIKTMIR